MIHQPHGYAGGQATDIAIQAEEILKTKKLLNELLSFHTNQPIAKIEAAVERDTFLSPTEALDFGLIDNVLVHDHSVNDS
jgi:ATP-dependent Clp protease protease subunit